MEEKNTVDTRLDLLKYTSDVQSRVKKDITSDFILAKLKEVARNTTNIAILG